MSIPVSNQVMLMVRAAAGITLVFSIAAAQPADTPPAFEVASIRASAPGGGGRRGGPGGLFRNENIQVGPESVTMRNVSLRSCIRWAYHVMDYQVTGPSSITENRFDVVAKATGAASEDQLRLMLQTLLAERFKLAVHRTTKEMSAWILTVAKGGPKFKESVSEGDGSIQPNMQKMELAVQRTGVPQLVDLLATILQAPVIDETGLKGKYDITIRVDKYIPDPATPVDMLSTVLRGIQEELGLKLDQRRMPIDLVVVDHAERTPVEN